MKSVLQSQKKTDKYPYLLNFNKKSFLNNVNFLIMPKQPNKDLLHEKIQKKKNKTKYENLYTQT